jgi:hypothetical protein
MSLLNEGMGVKLGSYLERIAKTGDICEEVVEENLDLRVKK